ncbi:MAG: BspA family leucine-rich repeat surface protein [Prevotella sp.]|nr:BspA family leucine-rich repeat surface protein [Prevotella sp.]
MRKIYVLILFIFTTIFNVLAQTSPKSVNIEKTLMVGEQMKINPWTDFCAENKSATGSLLPYGDFLTWYVDGKKNDKTVFSVTTWKVSGNSHPNGTITNYPYNYNTYTLKANEGGTHIFSVKVEYIWLYTNKNGIKVQNVNSKTITYTIHVPIDEAYAALNEDNTILTFYYDKNKDNRSGMDIGPFVDHDEIGWYKYHDNITTVVFDKSFDKYYGVTSTELWFHSCKNLVNVINLEYLHTDKVEYMGGMFMGCSSLTSLDVSTFNTQNVTLMCGMFSGCSSLNAIDLSNFDTSKVTELWQMFMNCSSLYSIDLSSFDASSAYGNSMFQMFFGCTALKEIKFGSFNPLNAKSLSGMFASCKTLEALDLSSFDTRKVENMGDMFYACENLRTIYVSDKWDTKSVTYSRGMFYGCYKLIGEQGTPYISTHEDYLYARVDNGESSPGYFTNKSTSDFSTAKFTIDYIDKIYNLNGQHIDNYKKGLNIIRKSNGTSKKMIMK